MYEGLLLALLHVLVFEVQPCLHSHSEISIFTRQHFYNAQVCRLLWVPDSIGNISYNSGRPDRDVCLIQTSSLVKDLPGKNACKVICKEHQNLTNIPLKSKLHMQREHQLNRQRTMLCLSVYWSCS